MFVPIPASESTRGGDPCTKPNTFGIETSDNGDDFGFCCNHVTQPKASYHNNDDARACIDDPKTNSTPSVLPAVRKVGI